MAKENVTTKDEGGEIKDRERHPTLYPGEVVSSVETDEKPDTRGRNMAQLPNRARNNRHKQERKSETHWEKRIRLAKREEGSRLVSDRPERKAGGGWELPARTEDTAARRLLGGHDGKGRYRVFKDDTMDLAHEEEYAGHPILRLFTRPEEIEKGPHRDITTEDIRQMNGAEGKEAHAQDIISGHVATRET
eukprot:4685256-Pleurochrysis_carterae.AAC.3